MCIAAVQAHIIEQARRIVIVVTIYAANLVSSDSFAAVPSRHLASLRIVFSGSASSTVTAADTVYMPQGFCFGAFLPWIIFRKKLHLL